MIFQVKPPIDYYRIQGRYVWYTGHDTYRRPRRRAYYRPDHLWSRTWQAEWPGCKRAPRAFTKWGCVRKAERAVLRWMRDW